jgi:hypothetical protein
LQNIYLIDYKNALDIVSKGRSSNLYKCIIPHCPNRAKISAPDTYIHDDHFPAPDTYIHDDNFPAHDTYIHDAHFPTLVKAWVTGWVKLAL